MSLSIVPHPTYAGLGPCKAPSQQTLEVLRFELHSEAFEGLIHDNATSLYELNWLCIPDIIHNWALLASEPDKQETLTAVINASWRDNIYRRGLKHQCPLIDHLLLMTMGRGVDRFPRYGSRLVTSCLKNRADGLYSQDKVNVRVINPPHAKSEAEEFVKEHRLELLFGPFVARILLFEPQDDSLEFIGSWSGNNTETRRGEYEQFFNSVTGHLGRLIKRHKIWSYVASCEIACRSIRNSLYHPHVHAIVWVEPDDCADWLEYELPPNVRLCRPGGIITSWEGIDKFVRYLFQVNSIAEVYRREWQEDEGIREFNVKTVNAWETIIRLVSGDASGRAYKRIRFRGLPGKGPEFVHREYEAFKRGSDKHGR